MTPSEVFIQKIKCQNYKMCDELLSEHDKQIRADAIDEFMESLELWNNKIKAIRGTDSFFTIDNIRKMAEQLKEQTNE